MSITRDFEDNWCDGFPDGKVYELLEHARALEAMLRKHEWSDGYYCPECHLDDLAGHSPDCPLAKLIGE